MGPKNDEGMPTWTVAWFKIKTKKGWKAKNIAFEPFKVRGKLQTDDLDIRSFRLRVDDKDLTKEGMANKNTHPKFKSGFTDRVLAFARSEELDEHGTEDEMDPTETDREDDGDEEECHSADDEEEGDDDDGDIEEEDDDDGEEEGDDDGEGGGDDELVEEAEEEETRRSTKRRCAPGAVVPTKRKQRAAPGARAGASSHGVQPDASVEEASAAARPDQPGAGDEEEAQARESGSPV